MDHKFKEFVDEVITASLDGVDLDGGEIQDLGLHLGLLEEINGTESCGSHCICYDLDNIPGTCIRKTYNLKGSK